MAVKITDLGPATIPLAGTEQLEIVQDGDSRRVSADDLAAAAAGLDATFVTITVNPNLPNERVLTEGVGIDIVDGGAGLAVTVSLNPVTLPLLGDINTATPPVSEAITDLIAFRDAQDVNLIGSIGYNAANELLIQNEMRGGGVRIRGRLTAAGALTTFFQGLPDSFTFIGSPGALSGDGKDMFLTTGDGATGPDSGGDLVLETGRGGGSGTPGRVRIEQGNLFFAEHTAAEADLIAYGQFWVRDDVPNTPMFTDDVGTDFELNAAGAIPDPLIIGSINLTSALGVSSTGTPYDNVPINIGANLTGTMPMTQLSRQNIQTKPSAFGFNATLFININGAGTAGSDTIIGGLNSAQLEVAFGVSVRMQHGLSSTMVFETIDTGILLPEGSVFIDEKAAQETAVAARGEFWVRNDVPNVPMFTNDVGTDFVLNAAGAAPEQLVDPSSNVAVIALGSGTSAIRSVGNIDAEGRELEWQLANGTTRFSIGNEFFTDMLLRNHITGRHIIFRVGTGPGNRIRLHLDGDQTTGGASLYAGTSGTPKLQTQVDGVQLGHGNPVGGGVYMPSKVSQAPDHVASGQLYCDFNDNDALHFVTGLGVDTNLLTANQTPWAQAIDGAGFDLNDIGVLFMREQAAQEADVAGQLQFWVRDDAFDQSLRVITSSGLVIPLAAINESDINDNTILVAGVGFVEILVSQPKQNQKYVYQASLQVSSPAADDIAIEMVIDTLATFSGMVSWTGGGGSGQERLHSAIGEVITNIVNISTDGSVTPDGTFITIIGCLINGNQSTTTMSVRVAKQLDTGADAFVYLGAGHSWRAVQSF